MNAPSAAKHTGRRAARFNLWAAIAIVAAFSVFAVKAAVDNQHVPAGFYGPPWHETSH